MVTGGKPHFCLEIAAPPLMDGSAVWVAEQGLFDGLASPSVGTEELGQKEVWGVCGLLTAPCRGDPYPNCRALRLFLISLLAGTRCSLTAGVCWSMSPQWD